MNPKKPRRGRRGFFGFLWGTMVGRENPSDAIPSTAAAVAAVAIVASIRPSGLVLYFGLTARS
jgi:hypothetical protein